MFLRLPSPRIGTQRIFKSAVLPQPEFLGIVFDDDDDDDAAWLSIEMIEIKHNARAKFVEHNESELYSG